MSRRRMTVEIDEGLFLKLNDYLAWGLRRPVLERLMEELILSIEQNGTGVISKILNNEVSLHVHDP